MRHLHRLCVVAAALLLAPRATPVRGEEYAVTLRVRDRVTREAIERVTCALLDPASGDFYARFEGLVYRGPRKPAVGDKIYVYVRGYDLRIDPVPDDLGAMQFDMNRESDFCELVLEGEGAEKARYRARATTYVPGPWTEGPFRDVAIHEGGADPLRIYIPRGAVVRLWLESPVGVVSPFLFHGLPGKRHTLRFEGDRVVPVLQDPGAEVEDIIQVEFLPDFLWKPEASPEQVDAWRWNINASHWLAEGLFENPPCVRLRPPIPFHVFLRLGDEAVYRYAPLGTERLDFRGPHRYAEIAARPLVSGKPVPEGTCIAPGRLDAVTLTTILSLRRDLQGCCEVLGPPAAPWRRIRLPLGDWLTAWQPSMGLVHMRWRPDEAPSGEPYPGEVEVVLAAGRRAKGYVSVYPVWKGAGGVKTTPPDKPMRKHFRDDVRELRFPSLPAGQYSMDIEVDFLDEAPGQAPDRHGVQEVEVTEARPRVRIVLGEE